ncbi:MAG: rRNA methyltransferase [Actinobacteria bacterium]|nr:rRNA methyltransferase [Actinomycetota bacterium]
MKLQPKRATQFLGDWLAINDLGDERVSLYWQLTDVQLRAQLEPEHGIFVAEGAKVIERAMDAGYEPISVLATEKWLHLLDDSALLPVSTPRFCAGEDLLEELTGFRVHRGALALMRRRPLVSVSELIASAQRIVLLEDLKEHTNVGAIMRCAAAFGVDAVIVSPACADPLYRRAVKVSMGTVFQVPWTVSDDWSQTLTQVCSAGFTTAALTPDAQAQDIRVWSTTALDKVALVFGTEGPGLTMQTVQNCDALLRIPMASGVDSLNVAAAAAVALFALQN